MAKQLLTCFASAAVTGRLIAFFTVFVSGAALAHSGGAHFDTGLLTFFLSGIAHPLTGFDHLVMLIGVGFIAGQIKPRSQQLSLMFVALLSLLLGLGCGALTGFSIGIEAMILASVFVAAVAIYQLQSSKAGQLAKGMAVAAVAMVMFHGWAHGLEAPVDSLIGFAPGMLVGASLLITAGYQLGRMVNPKWQSALLAISGVLLVIAS
ncbi:HupE/UreJ family protein [Photobacterium sp. SDRW27]|uniref:HupE/UreJ family protein n=1 Tax=Photobacterium obscurum TaxID=2829490 RepID=UPI0022449A62|nr:HupE/UreJ family protein [Photobacterium obscurum]MCW8330185.1 HupE/UreJ family protein [Photobacterium obscurum]